MGEKFEILNFVASRLLHRSPENISARYFERGVVDIVYFYVNFLFLTKALSCPCRHFFKKYFYPYPHPLERSANAPENFSFSTDPR